MIYNMYKLDLILTIVDIIMQFNNLLITFLANNSIGGERLFEIDE